MRLATLLLSALASVPAFAAVEDFRYKIDVLAEGMAQPMELELAPDGRIFFNEIGGKLRILKAGAKDNGKPGLRTDYSPNYYAAFLVDFDGNNVEAVCTA